MATFDVDVGGVTYEVDAPDENTAWKWANQTHKQTQAPASSQDVPRETPPQRRPTVGAQMPLEATPEYKRQIGLTARHGIEGVGGTLDFLSSPIRGAINAVLPNDSQIKGETGKWLADKLGLPTPEGSTERVVGDIARTMAGTGGMAGLAGKAAPMLQGVPQKMAQLLSANTGTQTASAIGAGAAGGITRESGGDPTEQFMASLIGGAALPLASIPAKTIGNKAADMASTIGASFGNKSGIDRIAKDAAVRVAGDSRAEQIRALQNATEYVPGVRPTAAEAIAEAQKGRPSQFGGATIKLQKDLTGAKGVEDILTGNARTQKQGLADYTTTVKAQTKPMREAALQGANAGGGVFADDVISGIDAALAKPGQRASDVVEKSLSAVRQKIESLRDPTTGRIDAEDLYTVRKEIGNTIERYAKETANWDKRLSARIEGDVQRLIDDGIENAGGVGWKDYLRTYSGGMRNVESTLSRQKDAKLLAAPLKGSNAADLAAGELPKLPNLLSRPAMATNFALKLISRDANTPVMKRIAEAMTDPQEYARLLSLPAKDPLGVQAREIAKRAAMAATMYQEGAQP